MNGVEGDLGFEVITRGALKNAGEGLSRDFRQPLLARKKSDLSGIRGEVEPYF